MANVKRKTTVIFFNEENDKKYVSFSTLPEASLFLKLVESAYKYSSIKGFKRPILKKAEYQGGLEEACEGANYTVGIGKEY